MNANKDLCMSNKRKFGFGGQYLAKDLAERILEILVSKKYIDGEVFALLGNYSWYELNDVYVSQATQNKL